jgi:acetyl-CoA synthetase
MEWSPIHKPAPNGAVPPHLRDYEQVRADFSWAAIRDELDGLPGERGLTIAYEAVDRHAASKRDGHVALRWVNTDDGVLEFTYRDLKTLTSRFANILRDRDLNESDLSTRETAS